MIWDGLPWHWTIPSWERGNMGKVILFPYPILFFSHAILELFHWKPVFHKVSFIKQWLPKAVFSRDSRSTAEKAGAGSRVTAVPTAGTKVCMSVTWHTGKQDSFWVPCYRVLDSIGTTRAFLSMDGCQIVVFEGVIWTRINLFGANKPCSIDSLWLFDFWSENKQTNKQTKQTGQKLE